MKPIFIIFFGLFLFISDLIAQDSSNIKPKPPIPLEVLIGNNRLYYQMMINKTITKNNQLGILNASSFTTDYKNDVSKNEYGTTTALYFNIFKGVGVHAGATMNSVEDIRPFVGVQYMHMNKTLQILYLPSYYYLENSKITNLLMIEFKPIIKNKWSVYSRLQGYYAFNTNSGSHTRSYLQARMGFTYSIYTFGVGANIDWYGEHRIEKDNFGVFVRMTI